MEPSRRPSDGRYGENPNRLYQHHQFQVIIKPSPDNIQEIYLESLKRLGIDPLKHDIRFVEDNWENPSLGCAGLGWEVWLDGMEITQFTYFQQVGGIETNPVAVEITYGMERLASYIQDKENVFDLEWVEGITYGDVFRQPEFEHSKYTFEVSDVKMLFTLFNMHEEEANKAMAQHLVFPAYDYVLKCSHTFNLLDARGAISVTERTGYITRVRNLARQVAATYMEEREKLGFPLIKKGEPSMSKDLLFEIGLEEVPARFMRAAIAQLQERVVKWLDASRIAYGEVNAYATPRRLAVLIHNVAEKQEDIEEEVKGPSRKIAQDDSGNWSKAALGFARSQGVEPDQFTFKELNGVEYIYATKSSKGVETASVVGEGLLSVLHAMTFPKFMRWASYDFKFVRPIRWIVAMLGSEVIDLEVTGVKSGNVTRGHRFLGKEAVISTPSSYVEVLRSEHVIADIQEREQMIVSQIQALAAEKNGILRLRKTCWRKFCSWWKHLPYCSGHLTLHS